MITISRCFWHFAFVSRQYNSAREERPEEKTRTQDEGWDKHYHQTVSPAKRGMSQMEGDDGDDDE
ncbi:hypothetical protein BC939DRAFT_462008 [Gamsiella multidivaricata]|uniref:uncharacterized protein n=1 Tax=Gamsiella multidivaricata TaxID=101098 RepID=UPI00221FCC23|nr:uncharacterized protein BC939DRAFT_462008 [Gamsiella multidivaricata]KAI7818784.1 hypothetical protein BC939DRAFT_462008 [Gamsiella multidivaricata]